MKANKFFAVALAALTLVSFASCDKKDSDQKGGGSSETALALDPTSAQLEVGGTVTITATVAATWSSSNAAVASVAPGNDGGKTALVTALAEGSAIISATANGQTKTCVVAVKKKGGEGAQLKGTQIWPIILDGTTYAANENKVVATFQPNDVDQFLYVWDGTYVGGTASGKNFYGNTDGYTALTVAGLGWAGAGFCLTADGNGWQAAEALRAAIVANPDDYYLHFAMKSTDNYSHCFYFMGSEATKFGIGSTAVYDAPSATLKDFTRDGSWAEFDIPMSAYASALATPVAAGVNVFVMLTEGVQGAALNIDAVYFYKK
jgi:hypothetical protein